LDFVSKLDLLLPVSRIGMGSSFHFSVFKYGLEASELSTIYYNGGRQFSVSFLPLAVMVFDNFPAVLEELESYVSTPFFIVIN